MTNITASILILIATNWIDIGTLTLKNGDSFRVEEGSLVTNTTAIFEYENKEHRFVLKSQPGPKVDERRVRNDAYVTNRLHIDGVTNYYYPLYLTNDVYIITNITVPGTW